MLHLNGDALVDRVARTKARLRVVGLYLARLFNSIKKV